jgi:hypothetical protein
MSIEGPDPRDGQVISTACLSPDIEVSTAAAGRLQGATARGAEHGSAARLTRMEGDESVFHGYPCSHVPIRVLRTLEGAFASGPWPSPQPARAPRHTSKKSHVTVLEL